MRRCLPISAAALVAIAAVAVAARAQIPDEPSPEEVEAARERFDAGVAAAGTGDFSTALEAFEASYALNPRPVVLINIGSCRQALGDAPGAIESFRAYLGTAGDDVPPERREQIEREIAALEVQATALEIAVSEPGAGILVDGLSVGVSPLAVPVRVDPGMVEIRVRKPGFDEAVVVVVAGRGRVTPVEIMLVPSAPPGSALPEVPGEESGEIDLVSSWWFWTAIGAAVAVIVVTTTVVTWPDDDDPAADWTVWGR